MARKFEGSSARPISVLPCKSERNPKELKSWTVELGPDSGGTSFLCVFLEFQSNLTHSIPSRSCLFTFPCPRVNEEAARGNKSLGCLNAAVEATSLNDRAFNRLLPQDAFIRNNIDKDDVLVVSVGGNDVALGRGYGWGRGLCNTM